MLIYNYIYIIYCIFVGIYLCHYIEQLFRSLWGITLHNIEDWTCDLIMSGSRRCWSLSLFSPHPWQCDGWGWVCLAPEETRLVRSGVYATYNERLLRSRYSDITGNLAYLTLDFSFLCLEKASVSKMKTSLAMSSINSNKQHKHFDLIKQDSCKKEYSLLYFLWYSLMRQVRPVHRLVHQMFSFLPSVTCWSPQDSVDILQDHPEGNHVDRAEVQ